MFFSDRFFTSMSSFEFKEDNNKLKDARPSIFIFIGDRLIEFQEYIICNNFNSENLLHIYTTKTFEKDTLFKKLLT